MSRAGGPSEVAHVNVGIGVQDAELRSGMAGAKTQVDEFASSTERGGRSVVGTFRNITRAIVAPIAIFYSLSRATRLFFNLIDERQNAVAKFQASLDFGNLDAAIAATNAKLLELNTRLVGEDINLFTKIKNELTDVDKQISDTQALLDRLIGFRNVEDQRKASEKADTIRRAIEKEIADRLDGVEAVNFAEQRTLAEIQRQRDAGVNAEQDALLDRLEAEVQINAERKRGLAQAAALEKELAEHDETRLAAWEAQVEFARQLEAHQREVTQAQQAGLENLLSVQSRFEERMVVSLGRLVELAEMSARNQRR